jgi:hypothetical protein
MKRVTLVAVAVLSLGSVAAIHAPASSALPTNVAKTCKPGFRHAVIAGRHECLRAGARCRRRFDRRYHRYGFHCHSGRLTRVARVRRPAQPPTLPEPPPPAGELIDIGGYRLHLECVGTAAPTVVIEAGATATRIGLRNIQYALSSGTRVCTYDRPGTWAPVPSASDPRPPGVAPTSETFARELRTLLANANVPGPYLLAGNSFAGLLISTFTARYPLDVAGLVFIDAFAPSAAEIFVRFPPPEPWDVSADLERLRTLNFGPRPVVVLATTVLGESPDLRRRATNILVAEAPQYGHLVNLEAPGLVYEAIRVAIAAVRASGPLPRCAQTPLARLVFRCTP